eukprot:scaffold9941_cov116-Isochrysis_galbana.AAC.4
MRNPTRWLPRRPVRCLSRARTHLCVSRGVWSHVLSVDNVLAIPLASCRASQTARQPHATPAAERQFI